MNKINYCWDTCVLIAWIREEADKPLADISAVVEQIDDGRVNLILPVTCYSELLESRFTPDQLKSIDEWMKRSNIVLANTTQIVAQKARDIRSKALTKKPHPVSIKQPDAIVMATAIVFDADVLHTFDEKMLNLGGSEILEGLKVTPPMDISGQRALFRKEQ